MSDRLMIQTLAFASREFDRLYDALVTQEEPGPEEVADDPAEAADRAQAEQAQERKGGALRTAASLAAGVARFGAERVTGTVHPRAQEWTGTDVEARIDWWQGRLSTAVAALAALPSATGRLGSVLGVVDAIGAAGQILMANAVGREVGADRAERIRVAAEVALGQTVPPAEIDDVLAGGDEEIDQAVAGQDEAQVDAEDGSRVGRLGQTARLVRTVAGRVRHLRSSLSERQKGGFLARVAANLPIVGAAGGFLAERGGMKRAADAAHREFTASR